GSFLGGRGEHAGTLDEIEARVFSRREREPSFYQGLFGPLLRLVLRGGIAYPWDLESISLRPHSKWMLTLEPCSSPGTAPAFVPRSRTDSFPRETSHYSCLRCFVGSYLSLLFHMERAMAASLRAIVSFARLGLVPAAIRRW